MKALSTRKNSWIERSYLIDLFKLIFITTVFVYSGSFAQEFTHITTDVVASQRLNSISASWIDYDNDGDLDLFVSNPSITSGNSLYRNLLKETGSATFNNLSAGDIGNPGPGSFGHSWADYDNDGDLDCYVVGRASSRLYRNDGQDKFTYIADSDIGTTDNRGFACAWGDYDNDSFVDLVVALPAGFAGLPFESNRLLKNDGDGTFTQIDSGATVINSGQAFYTVPSWSDYDQDGDIDLFIGSGPANGITDTDFLYRNLHVENGSEPFERILMGEIATTPRDGQVFNWIDYDNDRDLDVYITNYWGGQPNGLVNELYRNDGGSFTRINSGPLVTDESFSLASVWADYDNDGDLDVYVTTESGQNNNFYLNNGDGTFTRIDDTVVNNTNQRATWGATAGDYDNDGDIDLFVPTLGRKSGNARIKNFLFRNDLSAGNNWINISCIGTQSNKAAIGAKVHAKATINSEVVWQMREISAQNSFNGHNSFRVHFGLGDATTIDELIVEWPSGATDNLSNISTNQFITVTESGALPKTADEDAAALLPEDYSLSQNYPNPFNPSTTISYRLPEAAEVNLTIYNTMGQAVKTLVVGSQGAGERSVTWNATNDNGLRVPSGVYFYTLAAGEFVQTRKMLLIK